MGIHKMHKWNYLDRIIHAAEQRIHIFFGNIREEGDVTPEEMILAATSVLQEENEILKSYQIPARIVEKDGYYCPKCKCRLHADLIEVYDIRHCPECGKRFFRFEKANNPVKDPC